MQPKFWIAQRLDDDGFTWRDCGDPQREFFEVLPDLDPETGEPRWRVVGLYTAEDFEKLCRTIEN
jgi:hypothetical protein